MFLKGVKNCDTVTPSYSSRTLQLMFVWSLYQTHLKPNEVFF